MNVRGWTPVRFLRSAVIHDNYIVVMYDWAKRHRTRIEVLQGLHSLSLCFSKGFLIDVVQEICWYRLLAPLKLDLIYITIFDNILSLFSYVIGINRNMLYFIRANVAIVLWIMAIS